MLMFQLPTAEMDWIKIVVNFGSFAIVGWLIFYMFRVFIPKLTGDFTAQLDAARKHHENSMKAIIDSHERIVKDQRVDFREELHRQRAEFKEELQREREHFAQLLTTITK